MAKMRSDKVTEAKRLANNRYDAKTYRRITFNFRIQDDADILKDIDAAQSKGLSLREWAHEIFDNQKDR